MKFSYEDKFIEILQEELKLNEQLLELSKEKAQVLKDNDTAQLQYITYEEQGCLRRIIDLEKMRGNLITVMEDSLKIEKITDIKELVKSISEEKALVIEELGTKLRAVLEELKSINDLNREVVQFSLDYLQLNLNLINGNGSPSIYGKNANEKHDDSRMRFDNKF